MGAQIGLYMFWSRDSFMEDSQLLQGHIVDRLLEFRDWILLVYFSSLL